MYPTIRFRPRKDGKFSVQKLYCFIRLNGIMATRFSTNVDCIYNFNLKRQSFVGSKKEVDTLNEQVLRIRTEIREVFNKLCDLQLPLTAQILRDTYITEKESKSIQVPSTLKLFQNYIDYRKQTEYLEPGTITKYNKVKDYLSTFFVSKLKRNDIELQAINTQLGNDFFKYLKSHKNKKDEKVSHDYCFRTFQYFRASIDFAIKKKYLGENKLNGCAVERKPQIHKVHQLNDVDILSLYKCDGLTETERKIADGFVLMCYTGFRHSDYVIFLKNPQKYILKDESGFEYIELYSYKNRKDENQESSFIPLHPMVVEILKKYNYRLASYSNQVVNRYIKNIATRAGIYKDFDITTYTARKTCACLYGNLDGFEIKSVSKILGHKRVSTTETHYFKVKTETVKRQYLNAINK